MKLYYVQYMVKNIETKYLKIYFDSLEKILKQNNRINIKHSFVEAGNIYINVYVKDKDAYMAGKANSDLVNSLVVEAINFDIDDNEPKVEVRKVEEVK